MIDYETVFLLEKRGEYKNKLRSIFEIERYSGDFLERIIEENSSFDRKGVYAYLGKENPYLEPGEKLPNITLFWNLPFNNQHCFLGQSMGHTHPKNDMSVQEVYEMCGYGGVVVSRGDENNFYLCKARDKVAIPSDCMMTILSLSYDDFMTIDMSNPKKNESDKSLVKDNGPMFAFYHEKKANRYPEEVKMRINSTYSTFGLLNDVELTLKTEPKENGLYTALLENKAKLNEFNINLVQANEDITVIDKEGSIYHLDKPIVELIDGFDKRLHRLLDLY